MATRSRPPAEPRIEVERYPWAEVCEYFANEHKLGEHVSVEGPTGSGKSLLSVLLLLERGKRGTRDGRPTSIVALCDKPRDDTIQILLRAGWPRKTTLADWPPKYGEEQLVLWPVYGDPETVAKRQRAIFGPALREMFSAGGQIVYIDEAEYFSEPPPDGLAFKSILNQYWGKARASELTLFATTQRPVAVPRKMWSEPYWMFIFRPEDEDDLKRVAELSGSKQLVLDVVPTLDTHEFLMLRRRPVRLAAISQVELAR